MIYIYFFFFFINSFCSISSFFLYINWFLTIMELVCNFMDMKSWWFFDKFIFIFFFFFFRFEERCKIFVLINSKSWFLYDDKSLYQKFAFPLTKIMLHKKMAINFLILSNLFALWRFFITHNIIYRWYVP